VPLQTVLRIDSTPGDAARARALVEEAGGAVVAEEGAAGGPLVAVFHVAADAALAAVRVAAALDATGRPRMALATGEVEVARRRVDALAGLVAAPGADGVALLASSAAVMVTHALPVGADLVDRGPAPLAGAVAERVYELRWSAGDRAADGTATSNLGWARRAAARLMVGRDEQVARLEAAWQAALAGERRVVVVAGDPGIGKTTVAAELALRVHAAGGTVLYGRWDEEGLAPYQALREALGTYATACPRPMLRADVAQHAGELARLLPDIAARIGGVRPPLADDPDAERQRLFEAVREWLGAIAARRPVLLVLDDLQWADRSSLLLLRHVLDSPPAGPLLVVLTMRDGDVEGTGPLHRVGPLEDRGAPDRVDVAGLGVDDVRRLVGQALGRPVGEGESEATAWLASETAGNPLFLHEILRGLDPADPAAALRAARDRLPERVHDVVRWRLSGLSPGVEEALAAASLIGEEFPLDTLAAALGVRELDLRHRMDDAARAGVVREVGDGRHAAFTHAVVRRTLQDHVGPARAAALHRSIAEALVARDDAGAAEVAHHYLQSADGATAPLAVRWARAAADQARVETAFEGAVWFLSRALDVHDAYGDGSTPARELACELRLDLADAHDRAGEFTARDRRHLEAAELAREVDRLDLFTRAALGYGGRLPAAPPSNPRARELLEQVLDRLPETDSRARALALARLAHVRHGDAPHAERKVLADQAEAMARRLDAPVVLASVLCSRVLALDGPDDLDENLDIGAEVIRIGEQTGDQDLVLQGARARIQPLFALGAHDAARDLADRFAQLAATVRHPEHLRLAAMWQIMWAGLQGRFAEAEAEAGALRDRLEAAGHSQAGNLYAAETFVHRWLQGTLAGATPDVEGEEQLSPAGFTWWAMHVWALAGVGHTKSLARNLADRDVAELAAVDASYNWLMSVVGVTIAASTAGDATWAAAAHDALAPYSGRNCVMGYAAYLGAVDHHLGALAAVLGRADEAAEHLGAALERHRTIEARPWVALSAAWAANVLAERDGPGDAERSAVLHAEATALADELEMRSLPAPHARLTRDPSC
jgi:hypothetical protein